MAAALANGKPWRPSLPPEAREKLDEFEQRAGADFPDLGPRHFDRQGKPMTLADWAEAMEDAEYRVVANDVVESWEISTVWLGLNHGFGPGPPLIFETMVFDNSPEGLAESRAAVEAVFPGRGKAVPLGPDAFQNRYATEAEALKGHEEAVVAATAGLIRRYEDDEDD